MSRKNIWLAAILSLGGMMTASAGQVPASYPLSSSFGQPGKNTYIRPQHGNPNQPVIVLPPALPHDSGDLEDFLEEFLETQFRHCVDDVDVDVDGHHRIDVEVEARDFNAYAQIRHLLQTMPHLKGYRVRVMYRDLDDAVQRKIERAMGASVDDVDVDVEHDSYRIDIEVELRFPGAYQRLRQVLATLPELGGYQVRLDVEFDD